MSLNTSQVNYINIGLMIGSCLAAFQFPFELFLISYAVLGPLHYLTEISWLHERKYFTSGGGGKTAQRFHQGWLILVGVAMIMLIAGFIAVEGAGTRVSPKWEITSFYLVFFVALLVTEIKTRSARMITLAAALLLLALFAPSRFYI